jgi:hypothetical protein
MLTLFAVAWFVSGLVCLADLIDRRRERRRKPVAPTRIVVSSNVVPLHPAPSNCVKRERLVRVK